MKTNSNAKINISLDILGKLPNGYHELSTIMQEIPLYDEIEIEKAENISLSCSNQNLPTDINNTAFYAAKLFFEYSKINGGAKIFINKKTPFGAGLGGGSSNAATVLKCLNQLYNAKLSNEELKKIAVKIGADVPFFIDGQTSLANGIGEKLTPIKQFPKCYMVLIKPKFSINTAWAYKNFNFNKVEKHTKIEDIKNAIELNDLEFVAKNMFNVFESVVIPKNPQIAEIKETMNKNGALGSIMSGSGSSVFGIFIELEKAKITKEILKKYSDEIFICKID